MLGYNIYAYLNSWVSIAWGPNKIDSPEKMGTGEERKRGKGEGRREKGERGEWREGKGEKGRRTWLWLGRRMEIKGPNV